MSNNRAEPSPSKLPFLAVEYEDRKAAIGRNTNYQETLASIKKMFGAIRNAPDEDICINAHLEEMDDVFRIADEIWSELLPRLSSVKITLDPPNQLKKKEVTETTGVKIYLLRRPSGSWTGDVLQVFVIHIALSCTVGQLAEQLKQEENITSVVHLHYGGVNLYQKLSVTLAECGIQANSMVNTIF